MNSVFICDGVRTPIGRFGGSLATVRTDDLAAIPIRALLQRQPRLELDLIEDVFLGCANQAGEDNRNVARMASLLAGLPTSVPGLTLNRLCASGLEAVGSAYRAIACGDMDVAIAGGVESMSRSPLVIGKAESAFSRSQKLEDTTIGWRFINPRMQRLHGTDSMPQTADNVAREYGIARNDQDAFALRSQRRAARAQDRGDLADEIVPVTAVVGKQQIRVERDEHPRATVTMEQLAALHPVNGDGHTVTAGNASGVNDGAAALLIASERAVARLGLKPLARILGMASHGVSPRLMGTGPVPAVQKLNRRLGLVMSDYQVIELNEAFAAQALAVLRTLDIDDDAAHVNPNGGAIALGHPLGMSGARLALTATKELLRRDGELALITLCVGVGQGLALAVQRT